VNSITFEVIGLPAPQGSKSAYVRGGRAVIVDGSSKTGRDKHAQWRDDVCRAARLVATEMFMGPVWVGITFWMPLPKSAPHRWRHASAPDLDKLVRSVLDSLVNAGLLKDDSLVSHLAAAKWYARDGHWTGATIDIEDLSVREEEDQQKSKETQKAQFGKNKAP
jgi:Holliday junction resolvase RusA-like endonuclease